VKFSRKLLGKQVRKHINIKSVFKMSASLEHACLKSFTKVLDSPQVSEEGHSIDHLQSCASYLDCWWLIFVFILSTWLQNCNADYLRYQFDSETCRRRYTSLIPCFYLSTGWRSSKSRMQRMTGYTPLQWLYCEAWMATKLARS